MAALGMLALFLELSMIRWLPAHVPYLAFFTNMIMLGSFLGLSAGYLAIHSRRFFMAGFPSILALTMFAATSVYSAQNDLKTVLDVGGQTMSPQEIFFGTEYAFSGALAEFRLPIEWLAGGFFLCIAMCFVGVGQALGRTLDECPNKLQAYGWNILGSMVGVAGFGLCSWQQMQPYTWFAIISAVYCALFLSMRVQKLWLNILQILPLLFVLAASTSQTGHSLWQYDRTLNQLEWSPYYAIHYQPDARQIDVNNVNFQWMKGPVADDLYSAPYGLRRDSTPAASLDNVLVIGAGAGNDVSRALMFGAKHVDAVELDPAIAALGKLYHPLAPYADPRVTLHIVDGRQFLRHPPRHYDMVIFALVDSLMLHSSYANLRLESFLFTQESFADAKAALNPHGNLIIYNYYRRGWVSQRIAKTLQAVFDTPPLVFSLFRLAAVTEDTKGGFTLIVAGDTAAITQQFFTGHHYYLANHPVAADAYHGFTLPPALRGEELRLNTLAPSPDIRIATDTWPFLYLRTPAIPALNINGILIMLGAGFGLILLLTPRHEVQDRHDSVFFFLLGAGFMLLTANSIVRGMLLLGSSWLTLAVVSLIILGMSGIATLIVSYRLPRTITFYSALLLVILTAGYLTPLSMTHSFTGTLIFVLLLALPLLLSGILFSIRFVQSSTPTLALGYNTAGALVGGCLEYSSMVIGSQNIILLAIGLYAGAWLIILPKASTQ